MPYEFAEAMAKAKELKRPVDDCHGNRHFPPGADGVPIIGPTPENEKAPAG